jgi:hypothetical protein
VAYGVVTELCFLIIKPDLNSWVKGVNHSSPFFSGGVVIGDVTNHLIKKGCTSLGTPFVHLGVKVSDSLIEKGRAKDTEVEGIGETNGLNGFIKVGIGGECFRRNTARTVSTDTPFISSVGFRKEEIVDAVKDFLKVGDNTNFTGRKVFKCVMWDKVSVRKGLGIDKPFMDWSNGLKNETTPGFAVESIFRTIEWVRKSLSDTV